MLVLIFDIWYNLFTARCALKFSNKGEVMIKAVFIDYSGTTVMEGGKDMQAAVMRICKHSAVHDPKELMRIWWGMIKEYEAKSYAEAYLTSDEIYMKALRRLETEYGLKDDIPVLLGHISGCWATAPVFDDVKDFYENCPLPLYVITNNSVACVEKAMSLNGLKPAGIVSADSVRAYKPHAELFEKALDTAGVSASEAVHIGDSYESDVLGARVAGILPVLLQRTDGNKHDDVITVKSLVEVMPYLK